MEKAIKVKRTLKQVSEFNVAAEKFLDGKGFTKLHYAVHRMQKRTSDSKLFEKYNAEYLKVTDKIDELRVQKASVDEDGNLLRQDAGEKGDKYKFTKDAEAEMMRETKKITRAWEKKSEELLAEVVQIEPYYATEADIPENLAFDLRDAFEGFVIRLQD